MQTTLPAVLFDLDGTLVDTIELIMRSMEYAFGDFDGHRPTRDEWLLGLGIPLRTQLARHARSDDEMEEMIGRYRVYQNEHHDRMTAAFPRVPEVLSALRTAGHPLGIITSKLSAGAQRALEYTKLAPLFGTVIAGDSIANPKPHPEPVLTALARLRGTPDNAFFVGDSPHDIAAGNAAGVETVAVMWGPFNQEQLEAANPTHWLEKIEDLPRLVSRHRS